jgi:hypothetical protein
MAEIIDGGDLGASMDPTTDIKQMRDALMSRVDERLAHTYEQIKKRG